MKPRAGKAAERGRSDIRAAFFCCAELRRRNVSYICLVKKRCDIRVVDSNPNMRNKLLRGSFITVFLLQCLEAVGALSLRLRD